MTGGLPPSIERLAEALAREPGPVATLAALAELGGSPVAVLAVGWATVELERAAVELAAELAIEPPVAGAPDLHLGATALVGPGLVVLEPSTEGRLAASLARRGEGPCALYVAAPDRPSPVGRPVLTREEPGPLGPQRLVVAGGLGGPQVLVVRVPSGP